MSRHGPSSVDVVPAIRATTRPTVVAYGEVRPGVRTQLVAQVGGKITAIAPAFIEGGQFGPGDVLLSVEDTDYRAAVDERQARVAAAVVDLEQALADADVARKQLAGQKNPSSLALKKTAGGARTVCSEGGRNVTLACAHQS